MAIMLQRHYTDHLTGFVRKALQTPFHASTPPDYDSYHKSIRIDSPNSDIHISYGYMFSENVILSLV